LLLLRLGKLVVYFNLACEAILKGKIAKIVPKIILNIYETAIEQTRVQVHKQPQ
jgi:hypothetical protein